MSNCPPKHTVYLSEMLADNAVTLHQMRYPDCPGVDRFSCGDHFHIGHTSPAAKAECINKELPIRSYLNNP